jgi:hypothetical protein
MLKKGLRLNGVAIDASRRSSWANDLAFGCHQIARPHPGGFLAGRFAGAFCVEIACKIPRMR